QLRQVRDVRNQHQMVAPEVAHFAFHAALLIAPRRIAELRLKTPVRTETDQPLRLFPLMAAQNLLHRTLQVVVAQPLEDATEVAKRQLVRFQKSLLRGVIVGHMKRSAAGHRAHREYVDLAHLVRHLGHRLVPVHLRFAAPVVDLRNESLPPRLPQFLLALPHIAAHRRFTDARLRALLANPQPDPSRRMPLLPRSLFIGHQNHIDELDYRPQTRLAANRWLALRRNRTRQGLPHHPPMNPQPPRYALDRSSPVCVLPSDLLEQFHLRSPVHRPPCRLRRQSSQLASEGGPNVMSTRGPNQNSEIRRQRAPPAVASSVAREVPRREQKSWPEWTSAPDGESHSRCFFDTIARCGYVTESPVFMRLFVTGMVHPPILCGTTSAVAFASGRCRRAAAQTPRGSTARGHFPPPASAIARPPCAARTPTGWNHRRT